MKKQIIKWNEFEAIVTDMCRQITNSGWKPDYIVGITRGGTLPANMISQWFDVPMQALNVSLRDFPNCCSDCAMSEDAFNGKKILIVDDINDSGATIDWIVNDWQSSCLPDSDTWADIWNDSVRFATVVDNLSSDCEYRIDYAGMEIDKLENDVWIDFPWENFWKK